MYQKAELISVGTELLLGQIVNTNAAWISDQLASTGISVYYHTVVGDNLDRLANVMKEAEKRSDLVFITGGLGPTEDDLTREAFQKVTGIDIIEDENTMQKITSFFAQGNRTMTPNNRKQAHVFKGSIVLNNSVGIAPGIIMEHNEKHWIFMPGVPREMKAIMEEEVLPFLTSKIDLSASIESRMLRFIGIGESQLEHELQALISHQTNPTIAPLASEGEVGLRLTASADTKNEAYRLIDNVEKKITSIVGEYLYGYDQTTIESKVIALLQDKKLSIASAESLTGGAFASAIVDHKGVSSIFRGAAVVYQPMVKETILDIKNEIIEEFGTVSKECAEAMSLQVKEKYQSAIGISFTGVAGPDSIEGKTAGTVIISICNEENNYLTKEFLFNGDRQAVRSRSVKKAFELLYHYLRV